MVVGRQAITDNIIIVLSVVITTVVFYCFLPVFFFICFYTKKYNKTSRAFFCCLFGFVLLSLHPFLLAKKIYCLCVCCVDSKKIVFVFAFKNKNKKKPLNISCLINNFFSFSWISQIHFVVVNTLLVFLFCRHSSQIDSCSYFFWSDFARIFRF